jgi:hypothetical protein
VHKLVSLPLCIAFALASLANCDVHVHEFPSGAHTLHRHLKLHLLNLAHTASQASLEDIDQPAHYLELAAALQSHALDIDLMQVSELLIGATATSRERRIRPERVVWRGPPPLPDWHSLRAPPSAPVA